MGKITPLIQKVSALCAHVLPKLEGEKKSLKYYFSFIVRVSVCEIAMRKLKELLPVSERQARLPRCQLAETAASSSTPPTELSLYLKSKLGSAHTGVTRADVNESLIIPWDSVSFLLNCPSLIGVSRSVLSPWVYPVCIGCANIKIVGLTPRRPEVGQTIVPLFMGLFVSGCSVLVTPSPLKGQSKHACILHWGQLYLNLWLVLL